MSESKTGETEVAEPFSSTARASDTVDLVHRVRFHHLGLSHQQFADLLNIETRTWRYLRKGERNISTEFAARVNIMLLVHRVTNATLRGSGLSKAMLTSVKRAESVDDLKINDAELRGLLKEAINLQDYGLYGLSGAVCFAIWILDSDFSAKQKLASPDFLNTAIEHWERATQLAPPIASMTYAINVRTAKIHKEVYLLSNKPVQQPNAENHSVYRKYANSVNSVQAWRDALEQAALLDISAEIRYDFLALREAVKAGMISVEDEYEVVLAELRKIDGAEALQREPDFLEWVADITLRYQNMIVKRIAA